MEKAYQLLRQHHVQYASTGPQKLPETIPAAAGIEAFYFRDPDGHFLEIIHYPAGKGNAKWQQTNDQLFLGIDHTAIVISNTDESLKFYRDGLGLTLAGESENFGNEQEHLNNVFGARLRISGLISGAGPGIEFLNYLAPSNGRPYPVDAQSNDLLHWQTTVVVKDLAALADRLRQEDASFISPGIVELTDTKLGFQKGFLVRDPDGHVMRIVEQI
jgi:catechol 2,3-dioxygenase-like lactoylglutathione lyase family enzyme